MKSRLFGLLMLLAVAAPACSSASSSSPAPASPTTPSTTGTSATTLSAAYTSKCKSCHGADGSTKVGQAALKGSKTATATWESAIRDGAGGGSMPAFTTSQYTDANMKADYTVLTGQTWK